MPGGRRATSGAPGLRVGRFYKAPLARERRARSAHAAGTNLAVLLRKAARRLASEPEEGISMLGWAVTFLVIALIAGLLGFTGVAGAAAGIAKILFFVFLVIFVVALIAGRRGTSAPL